MENNSYNPQPLPQQPNPVPPAPANNPATYGQFQPDAQPQPEEPAKKSNKKLILIIVIALIPLLGIGLLV